MAKTSASAAKPRARKKPGRIAHQPSEEARGLVEVALAGGIEQKHVAHELGISVRSFQKHYKAEIASGGQRALLRVIARQYKAATAVKREDFVPACGMFILKARAGWKDHSTHEHFGAGGGPVILKFTKAEGRL